VLRFYTPQHNHSCGLDRQAKARSVGILDPHGTTVGHKTLPPTPAAFLRVSAPDRAELSVGGEGMVTW